MTQVSLNWLLNKRGVLAPIIGPKDVKQLEDNIGASGWKLTPEQMKQLDDASDIERPYPWSMIRNMNNDRILSSI